MSTTHIIIKNLLLATLANLIMDISFSKKNNGHFFFFWSLSKMFRGRERKIIMQNLNVYV